MRSGPKSPVALVAGLTLAGLMAGQEPARSQSSNEGAKPTVGQTERGSRDRFTMTPSAGGFVKLDTVTGAVSLCSRKGEGPMVCELAQDDRMALQVKLDRLTQENSDLRRELEDQRLAQDGSRERGGAAPKGQPTPDIAMPSDEQIDKAFSTVDRILEKLRKLARKYGSEPETETGKPL